MEKKDISKRRGEKKTTLLKASIIILGYLVILGLGFALGLNYAQNIYIINNKSNYSNSDEKKEIDIDNLSFFYGLKEKKQRRVPSKSNELPVTKSTKETEKTLIDQDLKENYKYSQDLKPNGGTASIATSVNENKSYRLNEEFFPENRNGNDNFISENLAFTIQVYSFKSAEISDRIVAELKKKGYPAYKSTIDLSENGLFYRVRIGHFKSRTEAIDLFEKISRTENKDAFITRY